MRKLLAIFGLVVLTGWPAAAQDQPSETTETFGAWTVRCRQAGDASRTCELLHSVQAQNGVLAQLAFGTPPGGAGPLAVVQVPLGVLVAQPVGLAPASGAALEIPFSTCLQIGCLAQREVSAEELDGLAAAPSAELTFAERTGRQVRVTIPLDGFRAALARLRAS